MWLSFIKKRIWRSFLKINIRNIFIYVSLTQDFSPFFFLLWGTSFWLNSLGSGKNTSLAMRTPYSLAWDWLLFSSFCPPTSWWLLKQFSVWLRVLWTRDITRVGGVGHGPSQHREKKNFEFYFFLGYWPPSH